ncbi:fasciclin domain-containing protein [Pontimicrobium sp. MEBiC06410]
MKTLKKLPLLLAIIALWSCSNDDDNSSPVNDPQPMNIVETAQATADLSSLVAAVIEADLATTLSGNGPFTVLAPTNAAFAEFMSTNGWADVTEIPDAALEQVLLNHVISGTVTSTGLSSLGAGYTNTLATGAGGNNMSLYFDATSSVKFNNLATVITPDVTASNGVVHIIDKVITLPSIVDHASNNPGFSNLVSALGAADGNLVNVLNGAGPFTVLAPDNTAFLNFLSANNFASLADVPTDVLSQVLLNHVINGAISSTDLTGLGNGYTNTSATGAGNNSMSIYYNTDSGVKFNGISTVTTADVVGTNGIIHAVDTVIGLPTVVDFATADPNFSSLVAALTRESSFTYVATLSTANGTSPAPFTVFAPTNTAFVDLLTELNLASLADIPTATLESTLNTHVVTNANVQDSGLSDGMMISTLGGMLTANVTGGATLTDPNNRVSNITFTNVQAANGVIHVIDKVLLE